MTKPFFVLFPALAVSFAHGALLVNLDPGDARFDSLTDADDAAGGFATGVPAPSKANGLTFNVTFTPAAGDLDSVNEAVNIIEVGGDANGSGLYLLGGELHFISKMNGNGTTFVSSFNDFALDSGNHLLGVKSSYGALSAGTEYTVAIIFDPVDASPSLEIAVLETGGTLSLESYSATGVGAKNNWHGDNSATAFRGGNVANLGGTIISTNANTTNPFHENNINANPFEGVQGQALYWNQPDPAIVPEPSGGVLILLGASLGIVRRRR